MWARHTQLIVCSSSILYFLFLFRPDDHYCIYCKSINKSSFSSVYARKLGLQTTNFEFHTSYGTITGINCIYSCYQWSVMLHVVTLEMLTVSFLDYNSKTNRKLKKKTLNKVPTIHFQENHIT